MTRSRRHPLASIQAAQRRRRTRQAVWRLVWGYRWAIAFGLGGWLLIAVAAFGAKELMLP